jgi:enoyl-CoA hydratase/carnithine racemase
MFDAGRATGGSAPKGRVQVESGLTYELRGAVAWLGLNRPARRNAISTALLGQVEAPAHPARGKARAMVVFGHGAKVAGPA